MSHATRDTASVSGASGTVVAIVPPRPARWVRDAIEVIESKLGGRVVVLSRPLPERPRPGGAIGAYLRQDERRFAEPDGPLQPHPEPIEPDSETPSAFALGLDFVGGPEPDRPDGAQIGWLRFDAAEPEWFEAALAAVQSARPVLESFARLKAEDGPENLALRHRSKTNPLSAWRTAELHAAKLPSAIAATVRDLLAGERPTMPPPPQEPAARGALGSSLGLGARLLGRWAGARFRERYTRRSWFLAVSRSDDALSRVVEGHVPPDLRTIEPPSDRFWADPFPVIAGSGHFVFVEEFVFGRGRAHITCLQLRGDNRVVAAEPVLEADHHLSYPFVFEWNDRWYMLPESYAGGGLTIYTADDFPSGWRPVAEIPDSADLVDATLVEVEGTWWLFASRQGERADGWDEDLHLYSASSPLGPWTPHPRNPVRIDPVGTRPAGRFFRKNGRLFRPAQDGSGRYGRAIVINEVRELSASTFEEVAVAQLEPTWAPGLLGTHTLNSAPGLFVLDGDRRRLESEG